MLLFVKLLFVMLLFVMVRDAFIVARVGVGLMPARDCVDGTELPRRRRSFPWRNP